MSVETFPKLVGAYYPGMSDTEINIEDDLAKLWVVLAEEEITELMDAISSDVIAKLPTWFQGGREQNNPKAICLYTTRYHKKI